jgi:hypothetical protein
MNILEAAKQGNVTEIAKLLKSGVDVNFRDQGQETALHYAAEKGHVKAIEFLLEKGADISATTILGDTPLHTAVLYNQTQATEKLLEKEANANAKDKTGLTPVHIASQHAYHEALKLLLKYEGDVNASNQDGRTPLHAAALGVSKGSSTLKTIEYLLEQGAKYSIQDVEGLAPRDLLYMHDWSYAEEYDKLVQALGDSNTHSNKSELD